jgi:hypothetical protein
MKITGSAKQKEDTNKIPMLDFFKNILLPKLDAKADKLSRQLDKKMQLRINMTMQHHM